MYTYDPCSYYNLIMFNIYVVLRCVMIFILIHTHAYDSFLKHDFITIRIYMWFKVLTWILFNQRLYVIWLLSWFHFNPYVFSSPVLLLLYIDLVIHIWELAMLQADLYTCVSLILPCFDPCMYWQALSIVSALYPYINDCVPS